MTESGAFEICYNVFNVRRIRENIGGLSPTGRAPWYIAFPVLSKNSNGAQKLDPRKACGDRRAPRRGTGFVVAIPLTSLYGLRATGVQSQLSPNIAMRLRESSN